MQLAAAADLLEGRLIGRDTHFSGVSTDTRTLEAGALFVALRGPRHDAHSLLGQAHARGAAGAVVERATACALPLVEVADTRRALGLLARAWRQRFTLPVVAVTGSAGKTTVKEMLAAMLGERHRTLVTRGNLNNDIGVPLTLFGLGAEHTAAVIEMGANRPGDIAELCTIAQPTVGIVTLCAPAHLEGFGDIESVARTKGQIIAQLPADGVAVVNLDDAFAPLWLAWAGRRRVVGFGSGGSVQATDVRAVDEGMDFTLTIGGEALPAHIAHRGAHNVRNALAAAAGAHALGLATPDIVRGLARARPVGGRLELRAGRAGACLIDDSYNANPASLAAALEVLAGLPGTRWLVLGDMGELGAEAERFHREAAAAATRAGVARVFALGALSRATVAAFGTGAEHFADHEHLIAALERALTAAPQPLTILIKGSRMMALERVVAALAATEGATC